MDTRETREESQERGKAEEREERKRLSLFLPHTNMNVKTFSFSKSLNTMW